jgi:uncharacterized membrane protein YfcA
MMMWPLNYIFYFLKKFQNKKERKKTKKKKKKKGGGHPLFFFFFFGLLSFTLGAQGSGQTHPQWVPGVARPPPWSQEGG